MLWMRSSVPLSSAVHVNMVKRIWSTSFSIMEPIPICPRILYGQNHWHGLHGGNTKKSLHCLNNMEQMNDDKERKFCVFSRSADSIACRHAQFKVCRLFKL